MADQNNNATLPQDPATAEGIAEDKGKGKAAEGATHDAAMDEDDDDDSSSDEDEEVSFPVAPFANIHPNMTLEPASWRR